MIPNKNIMSFLGLVALVMQNAEAKPGITAYEAIPQNRVKVPAEVLSLMNKYKLHATNEHSKLNDGDTCVMQAKAGGGYIMNVLESYQFTYEVLADSTSSNCPPLTITRDRDNYFVVNIPTNAKKGSVYTLTMTVTPLDETIPMPPATKMILTIK